MKNFTIEQTDTELKAIWRIPWIVMVFVFVFMAVWMTIWTGGCVGMFQGILKEPQAGKILFALPFFAGWFFGRRFLSGSCSDVRKSGSIPAV